MANNINSINGARTPNSTSEEDVESDSRMMFPRSRVTPEMYLDLCMRQTVTLSDFYDYCSLSFRYTALEGVDATSGVLISDIGIYYNRDFSNTDELIKPLATYFYHTELPYGPPTLEHVPYVSVRYQLAQLVLDRCIQDHVYNIKFYSTDDPEFDRLVYINRMFLRNLYYSCTELYNDVDLFNLKVMLYRVKVLVLNTIRDIHQVVCAKRCISCALADNLPVDDLYGLLYEIIEYLKPNLELLCPVIRDVMELRDDMNDLPDLVFIPEEEMFDPPVPNGGWVRDLTREGIEPHPGYDREYILQLERELRVILPRFRYAEVYYFFKDLVGADKARQILLEGLPSVLRNDQRLLQRVSGWIRDLTEEGIEPNPGMPQVFYFEAEEDACRYETTLRRAIPRIMKDPDVLDSVYNVLARAKHMKIKLEDIEEQYATFLNISDCAVLRMSFERFKWHRGHLIPLEFEECVLARNEKRQSSMSKLGVDYYDSLRALDPIEREVVKILSRFKMEAHVGGERPTFVSAMSGLGDVAVNGIKVRPIEVSSDTKVYLSEQIDKVAGMLQDFPDKLAGSFAKAFDFTSWFRCLESGGPQYFWIALAIIALLLWQYPRNRMVWLLAAVFAAYSSTKIDFGRLRSCVLGWCQFTPQTTEGEKDPLSTKIDLGATETYVDIACEALSMGVFGKVMIFDQTKDLNQRFCNAAKTSDCSSKFMKRVREWIVSMVRTIATKLGYEITVEAGPFAKELSHLQSIIHDLLIRAEKRTSNAVDAEMARKLHEYDIYHRELEFKIQNLKEDSHIRPILRDNLSRLRDIRTMVSEAGFTKEPNVEPRSVFLCGGSGVGKTDLSDYAITEIAIKGLDRESTIDFKENKNRFIFSPSVGSQYYDTYKAHPVVYWPDIFSALPVPGQENECTFWINAYGSNVFNLDMANLPEKGKIHLVASLLYAVSNKMTYDEAYFQKALSNTGALARRIQENAWAILVKPQYCQKTDKPKDWKNLPSFPNTFWKGLKEKFPDDFEKAHYPDWPNPGASPFWQKMDRNKVRDCEGRNLNAWYFIQWDWINGKPLPGGEIYEYAEWIKWNQTKYQEHLKYQTGRKSHQKEYLASKIDEHLKSLEPFVPQTTASEKFDEVFNLSDGEESNVEIPISPGLLDDSRGSSPLFFDAHSHVGDGGCEEVKEEELFLIDDEESVGASEAYYVDRELGVADMAPSRADVYTSVDIDGRPIQVPITVETRIEMNRAKLNCAMTNKADLVSYLHKLDACYEGLSAFVKQYYNDCMLANEHLKFSYYDRSFQGDMNHPIHVFLEEIPLGDLKKFIGWNIQDDMMMHVVRARSACDDAFASFVVGSSAILDKITAAIEHCSTAPLEWFKNTIVDALLSNTGKFALATVGFFAAIFTLVKMIDWFYPGEQLSTKDDASGEWIQPQQTVDEVFVGEEPEAHAGLNRTEADYIHKWSGNIFQLVLLRGLNERELANDPPPIMKAYEKTLGSMVFLGGHIGVTCDHIRQAIVELCKQPDYSYYRLALLPYSSMTTVPFKILEVSDLNMVPLDNDLAIIEFPRSAFHHFSCLYDQLPSSRDTSILNLRAMQRFSTCFMNKLDTGNVEYLKPEMRMSTSSMKYPLSMDMSRGQRKGEKVLLAEYTIRDVIYQFDSTTSGQSGSLAFVTDRARSTATPFPLYLHTAGNAAMGCGVALYREIFSDWVSKIKPHGVSISTVHDRIKDVNVVVGEFNAQAGDEDDFPVLDRSNFAPYHNVVARTDRLPCNVSSSIKRTQFYEPVKKKYGITRRPATLFNRGDDKAKIAREAYGSNVEQCINIRNVDYVTELICSWLFDKSSPIVNTRRLSYEESLKGCPAIHLKQVHAVSSCGYLLKVVKQEFGYHGKGKLWIFPDPEELNLDTPMAKALKRCYDQCTDKLMAGDRILNVYLDCLKDELRPFEKADKPRHFCAGDLTYLLQCRSAFGCFAGWIYENRVRTPYCIGINPYSREWTILFRMLRDMSDLGIFGDFSKFDKRQVQVLINFTRRLMERYYGIVIPTVIKFDTCCLKIWLILCMQYRMVIVQRCMSGSLV